MKVSVCMITYNHEKFIAQAVESVMMQQTDFDLELVVGEDCSTDGTRQVLAELREKYPDKIKLLLPESNLGMNRNFIQTLETCSGDYIALLEGDDYWTCSTKLAEQVAFLQANLQCVACFHNVEVIDHSVNAESTRSRLAAVGVQEEPFFPVPPREVLNLEDMVTRNYIPTCSFMVRGGVARRVIQSLPNRFFLLKMADWPLFILFAQHGGIARIKGTMATYRLHDGGVWSGKSSLYHLEKGCEMFDMLLQHLPEWRSLIRLCLQQYQWCLVLAYEDHEDIAAAKYYLKQYLRALPWRKLAGQHVLKTIFRLYVRKVYLIVRTARRRA